MSNRLTEAYALAGSPVKLSGTAIAVHAFLLHRFDDRPEVNGKPNKGYKKSYPSNEDICRFLAGMSRTSSNRAIEELIAKGLIYRCTIGKPSQRAEFVPIYALGLLEDFSVNYGLHVSKDYKNKKVAERVKPLDIMSKADAPNVLTEVNSISNITTTSKDKYENNYVRFNTLRLLLKNELRYLHGGKNYEEALEVLDHKGATIEEVARYLNSQNFANSKEIGGLVAYMLKNYADAYTSTKATVKREWCTYCESPENRIEEFAYEIPSIPEGATSRVCRKCG
jgi:hypothetical protein